MGFFGGRRETQHRASDQRVTLADPQAEDVKQAAYIGLDSAGLSLLIYGPGDVRSLFAFLRTAAPAFRSVELASDSPYLGKFPGREEIMWLALEGPAGSAITVHCFPNCDTEFTTMQISMPLSGPRAALPAPWEFGIGTVNAHVPARFADIFGVAAPVPLGILPGLNHLPVPTPTVTAVPGVIERDLLEDGWNQLQPGGSVFGVNIPIEPESRFVVFGPLAEAFGVTTRIGDSPNRILPAIPHLDTSRYRVELFDDTIMLIHPLPLPPALSYPMIREAAIEIAGYAQNLGGPTSAAPPPPSTTIQLPTPPDTPIPRTEPDPRPARPRPAPGTTMAKGANVSLTGKVPGLSAISVGLGWEPTTTVGAEFDLDASAIATGPDGKVIADEYFVFFNNLRSPDGCIEHTGDNRTGDGSGDDEIIDIDLAAMPTAITNIVFVVSIYDAIARGQSFGQVPDAFIRVVDRATDAELTRYDLTANASTETAMVFGELYRRGPEWKFRAIGQGYDSGLEGIARDYGVNV